MYWPPKQVYAVERISTRAKPYYGRKDKRLYAEAAHVRQFIGRSADQFKVYVMQEDFWEDVTDQFV